MQTRTCERRTKVEGVRCYASSMVHHLLETDCHFKFARESSLEARATKICVVRLL